MFLFVIVKLHSRQDVVIEGESGFLIYTTASPENGKANDRVIKLIATYLNISKSRVKIKSGLKNTKKIVEIL